MRSKTWLTFVGPVLGMALSGAAGAQPAPASPPASMAAPAAADTPQIAPFGVAFTVPKDWTARSGQGWVDIRPPEADSDIVIVDAGEAKDGPDAAAKAWALFRPPGMTRKVLLTPALPPREFWDEGVQVADEGSALVGAFERRLLEVLYDGKPLADGQIKATAVAQGQSVAKLRELVSDPPDAAAVAGLARHYASPELGRIEVRSEGPNVIFDFGPWKSRTVTRKNPDGTMTFITIEPGAPRAGFVVGAADGKRQLTVRDGQHTYVYAEAP